MCFSLHSIAVIYVLIVLNAFTQTVAQNYILILIDFKCIVNNEFVSNFSCFVGKVGKLQSANVDIQLKKGITDLRADLFIYKDNDVLFRLDNLDGCDFLANRPSIPMLQVYWDIAFNPPNSVPRSCPIPKDFHFQVSNITLESSVLPVYVPEIAFKVVLVKKDKKTMVWQSEVRGKVVRKKNNRIRKKS